MKAWNDAIYRMYQKAPSSYRVDQLSAEVFETQGKYTEAVAEYRKAIAKNPKAHQSALPAGTGAAATIARSGGAGAGAQGI